MVDSAGSDDGDDAGDSELPPPPQPGQQPVGVPNDADEKGRGVAKGILVLAALVFVVPLLAIGGLVLLFAGSGTREPVEESFSETDPRVIDSLDQDIRTDFARRISSSSPSVFLVEIDTEVPTTVVAINPQPGEQRQLGRSTRLYIGGQEIALPHDSQHALSTPEDCVSDCTIELTVADPFNLHIAGSSDVTALRAADIEEDWIPVDVQTPGRAIEGRPNVCLNGFDISDSLNDAQFVTVFPLEDGSDLGEAAYPLSRDPSARCQAEFTIPSGTWLPPFVPGVPRPVVELVIAYRGTSGPGNPDDITIELS